MPALLGIDFGTTTLKAVLFDERGAKLAAAAVETPLEQATIGGCAAEIWPADALWARACELLRDVCGRAPVAIDALAIVELGLVGVPLASDGRPLYPAVAWINPPDPLSGMVRELDDSAVFRATGNRVNPIYPPAWISWLRRNAPGYPTSFAHWLYSGDYAAFRLTGEMAVGTSMASQSTVFDQHTLEYRGDFLDAYGLRPEILARPRPAGEVLGTVTHAAAEATGLARGTPVIVGGADFVSGAYGAGILDPGAAAIITGTWECTVMCSEAPETGPVLERTAAICDPHVASGRWNVRVENLSGDVTEWYRAQMYPAVSSASDAGSWEQIVADAAAVSAGSGGVLFVPHVFGSFGPILDERARGAFVGLTNTTDRRRLTRAVYEGLCYQSRASLETLAVGMGQTTERVVMTGGGTRNAVWTRIRADVIGRPVEVVDDPDTTARGAAMIAGVGAGVFADFHAAARDMAAPTSVVTPDPAAVSTYDELYQVYTHLVDVLAPVSHRLADLSDPSGVA